MQPHRVEEPSHPDALFILNTLDALFPHLPIPLHHSNAYTLLVAVLLSAQCTDERVNRVTPALFARADNPRAMAALELSSIEALIRPCGLWARKARAIQQLSRLLLERHEGMVPGNLPALEALPGVGHKTASVVMAQAFGIPSFPVDTHIHRLAARWRLSSGKSVERTEADLKALFPESSWIRLHLQLIHYGRHYCPARGHVLANCPLCRHFSQQGTP